MWILDPIRNPGTLALLAAMLFVCQGITFQAGPARRSAAQPLLFLACLAVPPWLFWLPALLAAATHLPGRLGAARFAERREKIRPLLTGLFTQALRVLILAAVASTLPAEIRLSPGGLLLRLVPIDVGIGLALWLAQRRLRDRRRLRLSDSFGLAAGEAIADGVGGIAAFATPPAAAVVLAGVSSISLGLAGLFREKGHAADRAWSGAIRAGEMTAVTDVEPFLEALGRAVGRMVRFERIELDLLDEEGRWAGAWQLDREGVAPLPARPGGDAAGEPTDVAVDTADSFTPAALARPEPLPSELRVPVVDGQRVLGTLLVRSGDLPNLPLRHRRLFETIVRQATATLRAIRLQRLATTDPLTGLAIRRLFDLRLAEAVASVTAGRRGASLVFVDVDYFKSVNDRFGHPAGDAVLRALGRLLRESVRGRDLAARIGGEEFALLLPGTPATGAVTAADRIRATLADIVVPIESGSVQVTASFGVTQLVPGQSPADAVSIADRALYRAKESGRNRVVVASPAPIVAKGASAETAPDRPKLS
jgi:diguanylate cyclase (GGDEF)-like protein